MTLHIEDETPPPGYERLVSIEEPVSGLRAFICIHSTTLGPAAGGCRMWDYPNIEAARADVLRLAAGMTSKNALAGLELGGGKSVIIGNAKSDKSEDLLRAFGRAVDSLNGAYYTAEDVGISPEDMAIVAQETPYAVGLNGGEHGSGDPSPFTAEGVFQCMKVGADEVFGTPDLTGRRVLVMGLGHVGMALAEKLHAVGADLMVSDINQAVIDRAVTDLGASVCAVDAVFDQDMDIFAPCALGGVLNDETVGRLTARMVCGAANNQLATPKIAEKLRARGIRYLPDYVVNAGGIISVAGEIFKRGDTFREERLTGLAGRMGEILRLSHETDQPTIRVADQMVAEILNRSTKRKGAA